MTDNSRHSDATDRSPGVTIGDVIGGIHNSIIAGRDVIINTIAGGAAERRAQRNRGAMLELVRNTWIEGVLEQSLYGAAMIELGMEEQAEAVERPWDVVLQMPDRKERQLPPGTEILDVFDEMNRSLLILGGPGSGKTTMLLELARDTIARAEEDPMQPIPVVFNLSSWAEKRQPIAGWLVEEMNTKYQIPKRIARPWVENDDLLLLLDGLDEVPARHRDACMEAINEFLQEHMMPMAVCSRVADYRALTTRLKLQGAVLLQPLTPQQVDAYLDGAGTELVAVRQALQHDSTLQELARTPLMLGVITLAYQGMSAKDLQTLETTESRRSHVFDTYVQRMFKRRRVDERYSQKHTVRWLTWLAQQMSQHSQAVFLIEGLQPSWFSTRPQRWLYVVASRLLVGLSWGLSWGLVFGLVGGELGGLISITGLSLGLATGVIDGVRFEWSGKGSEIKSARPNFWQPTINALIVGLSLWLITALVFWPLGESSGGLVLGLIMGLPFGVTLGLRGSRQSATNDIQTVEALSWSWATSIKGAAVGSGIGAAIWLLAWLISELTGRVTGLNALLTLGLSGGLIGGLLGGLRGTKVEAKTSPNQGVRMSARNAVLGGLAGGLGVGLIYGLNFDPNSGLGVGLIFGSLLALWYGGFDLIQHYTLRFMLYQIGHIPWRCARFLDYAADRIFLRKVGGGYIFVHRLLQDYFASLHEE